MPSVAEETPALPQCRKRRRDDGSEYSSQNAISTTQIPFYPGGFAKVGTSTATESIFPSFPLHPQVNHHHQHHHILPAEKTTFEHHHGSFFHHNPPLVRKMIPLPASKRARVSVSGDPPFAQDQRHTSPQRQGTTKQPCSSSTRSPSRIGGSTTATATTAPTAATTASASLMSRCHICFRKPTKKSDLDSFADCQGCGQRTCYVCIRECLGWRLRDDPNRVTVVSATADDGDGDASFTMLDADDVSEPDMGNSDDSFRHHCMNHRTQEPNSWVRGGHRQMVCSRCCVERGEDGDVVCLGCLPYVEG
ncbi:hypothetical protein OQA88_4054 [Cercophora sp. LCS_1]